VGGEPVEVVVICVVLGWGLIQVTWKVEVG
jgi:hypothetical protein